jgi:hypothetical protein
MPPESGIWLNFPTGPYNAIDAFFIMESMPLGKAGDQLCGMNFLFPAGMNSQHEKYGT